MIDARWSRFRLLLSYLFSSTRRPLWRLLSFMNWSVLPTGRKIDCDIIENRTLRQIKFISKPIEINNTKKTFTFWQLDRSDMFTFKIQKIWLSHKVISKFSSWHEKLAKLLYFRWQNLPSAMPISKIFLSPRI